MFYGEKMVYGKTVLNGRTRDDDLMEPSLGGQRDKSLGRKQTLKFITSDSKDICVN